MRFNSLGGGEWMLLIQVITRHGTHGILFLIQAIVTSSRYDKQLSHTLRFIRMLAVMPSSRLSPSVICVLELRLPLAA
jgi:hypothetical protein